MPGRKFLYFNPRQSSPSTNTTDSPSSNVAAQTSVTTDAPTPTATDSQASTITTTTLPTSLSGSPQTSSIVGIVTSSIPSPQATSSSDVGTTTSTITTTAPPELTSSSAIPSTSSETSSSIPTSQPPTVTISSALSSTHTPGSTTTTTSSSSPSPILQNSPTSTTPTPTNGGQTTSFITSSFVTVIGPSTFTSETVIPTVISATTNNSGATDRTAIIAGSVIGAGLLLVLGLSVFFYRQRRRFKHFHFLDAINLRRQQASARATLLAGEDLEDVDLARPPPGRYSDYDTPWDPRDSSGSLNDTERGTLMGPAVRGADIDLSHIVDDVMGPSPSGVHYSQHSLSSAYHDLLGHDESEPQTREISGASQIALLEAAGLNSAGGPSMQPTRPSPLGKNAPAVTGGSNVP